MIERIFTLVIYFVLVGVIFFISRSRKSDIHFDEMQEKYRAEGYKRAYVSTMIMLAGIILYDFSVDGTLPKFVLSVLLVGVLTVGAIIWGIYCIKYDSFWGLGKTIKSQMYTCIIASFLQLVSFICQLVEILNKKMSSEQFERLFLPRLALGAFVALYFFALAIALVFKMLSKKECED